MKTEMAEFIHRIATLNDVKRDVTAPVTDIKYRFGRFYFQKKAVRVTPTAAGQLCAGAGIPPRFFLSAMTSPERAIMFNRLNARNSGVERLFRFHGDCLYGVVSPRYRKLDNIVLAQMLESVATQGPPLEPIRFDLNPDHTRVTFVREDAEAGDITPAIIATNSENGNGSFRLWAGVFRWVCSNGLMFPAGDITSARWPHIGGGDIELPDLYTILNRAAKHAQQLEDARGRYLSTADKAEIVSEVGKKFGRETADRVVEIANREYGCGRTLFDTVNSITRAAQKYSGATQTEMEIFAASLLAA